MAASHFERLLQPLLRHLNVTAPQFDAAQALHIDFDHLQLRLTALNDDELLMVASPGHLSESCPEQSAWLLLAQNDFSQPAPPVVVTVLGENRTLLIWCRERMAQLDPTTLITLFERLVDKAQACVRLAAFSAPESKDLP